MDKQPQLITVAMLAAGLADLDPEMVVVCSSDSEGNDFTPLAGIEPVGGGVGFTVPLPQQPWMGEVVDWPSPDESVRPCVILWPMN